MPHDRHRSWAGLALVAFLPLAVPAAATGSTFTDDVVPTAGFDISGSDVAWLRVGTDGVDLMLTNLTTRVTEEIAVAAASPVNFLVDGLQFDGRWVVWSQASNSKLRVYGLDLQERVARPLRPSTLNQQEVALDDGQAVWSEAGRLWSRALETRQDAELETGDGGARFPAISGSDLLWLRILPEQRVVMQGRLSEGHLEQILNVQQLPGVVPGPPQAAGGTGGWVATAAANASTTTLYVSRLAAPEAQAFASGLNLNGLVVDGSRLAWLDGSDSVWSTELDSGIHRPLGMSAQRVAISSSHAVAWQGSGDLGNLQTLAWNPAVPSSGLSMPSGWILAVALLGLAIGRRHMG